MHAIIGKVAQDATNIGVSAELRHGYCDRSPLALRCVLARTRLGRRYHTFRHRAMLRAKEFQTFTPRLTMQSSLVLFS